MAVRTYNTSNHILDVVDSDGSNSFHVIEGHIDVAEWLSDMRDLCYWSLFDQEVKCVFVDTVVMEGEMAKVGIDSSRSCKEPVYFTLRVFVTEVLDTVSD